MLVLTFNLTLLSLRCMWLFLRLCTWPVLAVHGVGTRLLSLLGWLLVASIGLLTFSALVYSLFWLIT